MFAKKTYRTGRWIERLLTIGVPDDKYRPDCEWLKIQPQYMVEVKGPPLLEDLLQGNPTDLEWKSVSHIRLIETDYEVYLQCLPTVGGSVDVNHQSKIRVTYSPPD